jgi:hypothetical protein
MGSAFKQMGCAVVLAVLATGTAALVIGWTWT